MKIRTSFVTNSSSYSSTELVIKNYFLESILRKYKEEVESAVEFLGDGSMRVGKESEDVTEPSSTMSSVFEMMTELINNYGDGSPEPSEELEKNKENIIKNMIDIDMRWENRNEEEEGDTYYVYYEYNIQTGEKGDICLKINWDESDLPEDPDRAEYIKDSSTLYDPKFGDEIHGW